MEKRAHKVDKLFVFSQMPGLKTAQSAQSAEKPTEKPAQPGHRPARYASEKHSHAGSEYPFICGANPKRLNPPEGEEC